MESEEDLLGQAIQGDQEALSTLLKRECPNVRTHIHARIAAAHRSLFDAEDVMQVTYLEAFLHIRGFVPQGPGSFGAWLRRLAENNLRDAVRELEREKRPSPEKRVAAVGSNSYVALVERLTSATSTASRALAREETRQALQQVLQRLPPDYADAIRLYELEELSGPEVAERMGKSHGAVRMILARARERLAAMLAADSRFSRSTV
jgi:RNA polymerase sigma-70 factor (ECF subfamily)